MSADDPGPQPDAEGAEVPFEDLVAAILKVDPEGIIGQQAKPKMEGEAPSAGS